MDTIRNSACQKLLGTFSRCRRFTDVKRDQRTPYATSRAGNCCVHSACAVGATFRRGPWWSRPEDATQRPLQVIHEGVGAERSSGAFMLAKRIRVLTSGAFAKKRPPVSDPCKQRPNLDRAVVAAQQMSTYATPRIVFRPDDETGANRVELDIPRGGECVSVVRDIRSKPALPYVSAPALAPVDLGRVAPVRFTDRASQASGRRGNRDEMVNGGEESRFRLASSRGSGHRDRQLGVV